MIAGTFYIAVITSIWLGFVLAISFMESWLKFKAKGVTLAVGLSIGKLIFRSLNLVEWFFIIIGAGFFFKEDMADLHNLPLFFACLALILVLQTFFLLPLLEERANRLISGEKVETSMIHLWYVLSEVLKVSFLVGNLVLLRW